MSFDTAPFSALPPVPSASVVKDLIHFLAANVDVAKADGEVLKEAGYRTMLETVQALAKNAHDLSQVSRVVVIAKGVRDTGRVLDESDLYDQGCFVSVQDDGATLKVLPLPAEDAVLKL